MLASLAVSVLLVQLCLGLKYNGVWLAGVFLTYQVGAASQLPWIGTAYVLAAGLFSVIGSAIAARPLSWHATDVLTILLSTLLVLSMFWTADAQASTAMIWQFLSAILGTYAIARGIRGRPQEIVWQMVIALAVGSALLAVCLINMRATGTWGADHRLVLQNSDASTVGLTQPIPFALLSALLMVLTFKGGVVRVVGTLCLLVVAYLAIASGTRGVFLSAIVSLLLALALSPKVSLVARNVLFVPIALTAAFLFHDDIPSDALQGQIDRLVGSVGADQIGRDASSVERIELFNVAFRLMQENPFFGVGFGGYGKFTFQAYPHNMFLEVGASVGAVGLALLIIWLVAHILELISVYIKDRIVGLILISFSCAAVLQLQVSFGFGTAKPLFLMVALGAAIRDRTLSQFLGWSDARVAMPSKTRAKAQVA